MVKAPAGEGVACHDNLNLPSTIVITRNPDLASRSTRRARPGSPGIFDASVPSHPGLASRAKLSHLTGPSTRFSMPSRPASLAKTSSVSAGRMTSEVGTAALMLGRWFVRQRDQRFRKGKFQDQFSMFVRHLQSCCQQVWLTALIP
jgi:hypothetical protein